MIEIRAWLPDGAVVDIAGATYKDAMREAERLDAVRVEAQGGVLVRVEGDLVWL